MNAVSTLAELSCEWSFTPLGDTALVIHVGDKIDEVTRQRVLAVQRVLAAEPVLGMIELVPAYTTVSLFYDPVLVIRAGAPGDQIVEWLSARISERLRDGLDGDAAEMVTASGRLIEIPVCYSGEFGPDLERVASQSGLSPGQVIDRHSQVEYLVHLIGFAPGFTYLGGLPAELETPRLTVPRRAVPAGSVGIAGQQTGVYPLATPGGWNLIGRTPLRLFRPEEDPPVLLQAGDRVVFRAITSDEFFTLEAEAS